MANPFSPNITLVPKKKSPFDPPDTAGMDPGTGINTAAPTLRPYAPPQSSMAPDVDNHPYSPVNIPTQQPDIDRDLNIPRLDALYHQSEEAFQPQHVSAGKEILGALVGGVTKNPYLGGLITGDTQRQRLIKALAGQEEYLGQLINTNEAQKKNAAELQNTQADIYLRGQQANQAGATTTYRNKQTELLGEPKPTEAEDIWHGYLKAANGDPVLANQNKIADIENAKPKPERAVTLQLPTGHKAPGKTDSQGNLLMEDGSRAPHGTTLFDKSTERQPTSNELAIQDYLSSKKLPNTPGNRINAMQELKILNRAPNQQEVTRADMADNLNENLDKLEDVLNRRPELFGPIGGRLTGLKQLIGSNDPDVGTLGAVHEQTGMAQASAHSMRNGHLVQEAANSIMNAMHSGPDAMRAAIKAARASVKTFQNDVDPAAQSSVRGGGAPSGGTVTMKAPNGQTKQVSADQVEHYKKLGAIVVP